MLNNIELIHTFDLTFGKNQVLSDKFKMAEMKALLYEKDYEFLDEPLKNWHNRIINYCQNRKIDVNQFKINPNII